MSYRNNMVKTFKEQHAPRRPLSDEEMDTIEEKVRTTWGNASEDEKADWTSVWRGQALGRDVERNSIVAMPEEEANTNFRQWCDGGDRQRPIDLGAIAHFMSNTTHKARKQLAMHDQLLLVSEAADRCSELAKVDPQHGMWGCYGLKKICRQTTPMPSSAVGKTSRPN